METIKRLEAGNSKFKQGYYQPDYPEKYQGDITKIFFRSSWERRFAVQYLDNNPNCLSWCSEEIPIPYYYPIDQKMHNYFIDFFCILKQNDNTNKGVFIEIKPYKSLSPPILKETIRTSTKRITQYNKECAEYIKNLAKFNAAKEFAIQRNCDFIVITEKDLRLQS